MMLIRFFLLSLTPSLLFSGVMGENDPSDYVWIQSEPVFIQIIHQKVWGLRRRCLAPSTNFTSREDGKSRDHGAGQKLNYTSSHPEQPHEVQKSDSDKISGWNLLIIHLRPFRPLSWHIFDDLMILSKGNLMLCRSFVLA